MRWMGRRQSSNVDDQRGRSGGGGFGGMGGGGMLTKGGLGTIVIIVIISLILGKNPLTLLQQTGMGGSQDYSMDQSAPVDPAQDESAQFVSVVLADTEDVWNQLMENYTEPVLVLFSGRVQSACGMASAASGPFYCPGDSRLYIDLDFYDELKSRLGAPGDFAQAYVIAHEVGHHVQHLLGITDKVHSMRERLSEEEYNKLSVRLELQADYFAGVWAHHAKQMNILEGGDLEEALNAATAIGDDKLQQDNQGYVVPDSFTHGTSEQRVRWFRKGYESGDPNGGDTFNVERL